MSNTPEHTDEEDYIADDATPSLPWWKRPIIMGLDAIWLTGVTLILVAAAVYLLQRQLGESVPPDNAFSDVVVETVAPGSTGTSAFPPASPPDTVMPDLSRVMSDVKAELDARDKTFNDSLTMMQDSIKRLGDALRRDEDYARETRQQLTTLQATLAGMQATAPAATATATASTPGAVAKKKVSAVSGMKVVSMEAGMAWVRWQGSTWAVREGDTLGKVTITRIDPATRTLHTSGGAVR
ncbi:conjugal transfer protein TraP [Klebsiella sp. PL-2018]|uniref:conjugal transfer protein TraP n=1 Tax=Klebsiella TaxID=570 RepID=UPI001C23F472|nr:conjugal transfer protein TraP [Klebsiella sp. PL-2018]QXD00992.1 IncI1 plasmid conjugative transfer protein TraP [Klebsiella sp. PL-2018]